MANGIFFNGTTSTVEVTGSLNVNAFGVTGSLQGNAASATTASYVETAQTASFVALEYGPGIIADPVTATAFSASVRSVNGVTPVAGNIAISITSTLTGTSASLSNALTGSLSTGSLWVISGDANPALNGETYILVDTGSNDLEWQQLSGFDVAQADARYLKLDGGNSPMNGPVNFGAFKVTNLGNATNMLDAANLGQVLNATASLRVDLNAAITSSITNLQAGVTASIVGFATTTSLDTFTASYLTDSASFSTRVTNLNASVTNINAFTSSVYTGSQEALVTTSSFEAYQTTINNWTSSAYTGSVEGFLSTSSFDAYTGSNASVFAGTASNAATASYVDVTGSGVQVNWNGSTLQLTASAGGGGTPGGSNTQIQYNNASAFGGVPTLTYDGTTLRATGSFTGSFAGTSLTTGSLFGTASRAISASWAPTSASVPNGGGTNQVLTKKTFTDQDLEWEDISVPASGSTLGLIPTFYDPDQGKVVYYDAPFAYASSGFNGWTTLSGGGTSGTPFRIEYFGDDTFGVFGDFAKWGSTLVSGSIVLDAQGNIVTTGSFQTNVTNMQSPGSVKVDSTYTNFYATFPAFPTPTAGANVNRWNTKTFAQDTTFATNIAAAAVKNGSVLDINDAGEIAQAGTNGTVANYRYVYKSNANGTLNTGFTSRFTGTFTGLTGVRDIAINSEGKVLWVATVSNATITYDSVSICTSFSGGVWILMNTNGAYIAHGLTNTSALISAVRRDATDPTKFIIGGSFTSLTYSTGATRTQYLQRMDSNGNFDTTWNTGGVGGIVQDRTKFRWIEPYYYIAQNTGATYNGVSIAGTGIYRIDRNGFLDSSFSLVSYAGVYNRDLIALSNGSFVSVGSTAEATVPKIAKWAKEGTLNMAVTTPTITNKALTSFTNGVQVTGSLSVTGSIIMGQPGTNSPVIYNTIPVASATFNPSTTAPWNTTAVPIGATFFDPTAEQMYIKTGQPAQWYYTSFVPN